MGKEGDNAISPAIKDPGPIFDGIELPFSRKLILFNEHVVPVKFLMIFLMIVGPVHRRVQLREFNEKIARNPLPNFTRNWLLQRQELHVVDDLLHDFIDGVRFTEFLSLFEMIGDGGRR